jgi:sulfate adenylyltransferase subunit 1 (EFTu-like GTPase family)
VDRQVRRWAAQAWQHNELGVNEIGRVQLRTTVPLLSDAYAKNRATGSFILIDEATGVTVGAGMING